GMQRRGQVLAGIVRLKQICNHPENLNDETRLALQSALGHKTTTGPLATESGKVLLLLERLEEVLAAGDQALIFTQYRRMGGLLERIIRRELDVSALFLHGGTPARKRQQMVDLFQDASVDTPIFILSLKAGGLGLNLTAANHVFHFDRWWNPAVENQATDRAFRIGQTRNVQVHKMVCAGTLEERIDQMLEEKSELAQKIIGSGDQWLTELSTEELRDLLMLRADVMEPVS
ncbi:MAG: DEAD/DEAH box helicase, partial [Phycisphaerales bacterium]